MYGRFSRVPDRNGRCSRSHPSHQQRESCQSEGQTIYRSGLITISMVGVLVASIGTLLHRARVPAGQTEATPPLRFFCAAVFQAPISEITRQFEAETGVRVEVQFGGSGTLLANLSLGNGDLYLAADEGYIDLAARRGWIDQRVAVAWITPGMIVQKGNPRGIVCTRDLVDQPGLRIALATPDAASIGQTTRKVLRQCGIWEQVRSRTLVFQPTVNELVVDVKLDAVDCAVVWDSVAALCEGVQWIATDEFTRARRQATVAVLCGSKQPDVARQFTQFLMSEDHGARILREFGFDVVRSADNPPDRSARVSGGITLPR